MTRIYVALDIETTGLDPEREAILEIGAVRFQGHQIQETYSSLVNPGRPIPHTIQQLTGIKPEDVRHAPTMPAIMLALRRFVGEVPIVGHNIKFDLSFLQQHGLFQHNIAIDTFELATILLPYAKRYSLTELLNYLNIEVSNNGQAHRALYDAQVAHLLFQGLLDRLQKLDPAIVDEIVRLSFQAKTTWPLSLIFDDVNRHRASRPAIANDGLPSIDKAAHSFESYLKPTDQPQPLDVVALAQTLEEDGLFAHSFTGFEYRPQQVAMLSHIAEAFNQAHHLIVEAGTGTGKSIAYLLPAIHWAVQNNQRVVISTNTINLQDQLLNKDVPTLQQVLPFSFKAVVLKGRSNYVCPRRVAMFQAKGNHSSLELRLLSKLLVWLPQTKTGDREELFMPDRAEQLLWWQVASDGNVCTGRTCTAHDCFYARAKRIAESAHIVIVNHALLLADIVVDNRVIPEYQHLVIDEAHHIEDSITEQLSFSVDRRTLDQLLRDLSYTTKGQPFGFIAELHQRCIGVIPARAKKSLVELAIKGHQQVAKARKEIAQLFQAVVNFAADFGGSSRYNQKIRLTETTRNRATWSNVELAWDSAALCLNELSRLLGQLNTLLTELENENIPDWEDLLAQLTFYRTNLDKIRANLQLLISEPKPEQIFWVEQSVQTENSSLHTAPLHVGNLFHEHLLKTKDVVVLTSATLRTNNSFEYFQERLHLWDIEEAAVGSPFDYHRSTLLYIPTNLPPPNASNYASMVSTGLINLAKQIKGRTLVLFTSYSQLKQITQMIARPLAEVGIKVYQQGSGASRRQLLDNFQTADQAILMGTRSFWEGVDIPGEVLSCVVITKLPFPVPSDPIISARSETFNNAFTQYSIPLAILAFRQGFGRLIRTKTDRGVVVIFDSRIISKNYGQVFLDSLPEVTERRGLLANLPDLAAQWLENVEPPHNF